MEWLLARSQDLKKGGGFFERVRKLQTTLTRIFIVLDGISRKTRKFKRFFSPKTGGLQKKVFIKIETDFSAKIGNSNAFSGRVTTSTSQLRHPIFFEGGCFHFFTKNRPQKHPKLAILHTLLANAYFTGFTCILYRPNTPPPPPGYATEWLGCNMVTESNISTETIILISKSY